MVKKKPKTKKQVALFGKKFSRPALLAGVVVIAVVGFAVYTAVANELDRRKFVRIEETVSSLVDQIDAEFETNVIADSSRCYEASRKFKNKPTICEYGKLLSVRPIDIPSIYLFVGGQTDYVSDGEEGFDNFYYRSTQGNYDCRLEYSKDDNTLNVYCLDYARTSLY